MQAARACPGTALDSDRLPLRPGQVCLAAPIIAKGEVLGAMLFADRQHEERSESARSTELALTADLLVGQVALMIYNARLHTQVRELAYALDHIGECVLVADTDGRIRYANRAVMTILGYEPDAVVGRSLADLTVGPLAPDLGALTQGKARWRHREGGEVPVALTSAPIPGGPEGQPRLVVLARDITDRSAARSKRPPTGPCCKPRTASWKRSSTPSPTTCGRHRLCAWSPGAAEHRLRPASTTPAATCCAPEREHRAHGAVD